MSGVFGKQKQSQNAVSLPYFKGTPYSNISYDPEGNPSLNLDPSIRGLQDEVLGNAGALQGSLSGRFGAINSNLSGIQNRFRDNASGFFQAVTNPVREAAAQSLGAAERNVGLRGLGGSSFGQQTIDNARFTGSRNVADAEALARMQQLTAEAGLNEQQSSLLMKEITSQAQLMGIPLSVALARLQQELSTFQLGTQQQGSASGSGFSLGFGLTNQSGGNAGTFGIP